jgi:rhodanese-related sulfurtransferase
MKSLTATEAWAAVQRGQGHLIDIREPGEFATVRAPQSLNLPLSSLEERAGEAPAGDLFLLCASGGRAVAAASIFRDHGRDAVVIEGGLGSWQRARLPLDAGHRRVWSMDRQVRLVAGLLVLTGLALGWFVHRGFFLLSTFVGAGLVFSGLTGFCGMAHVLARCPWNRGD